ncbi:MAG TPA: hypothetical protein V6D29_14630 [Leptolyngbyaceae cyanobacterium]
MGRKIFRYEYKPRQDISANTGQRLLSSVAYAVVVSVALDPPGTT